MTKNIMAKANSYLVTLSLVALLTVLCSMAYNQYQSAEYNKQARKTSEQIERTSQAQEDASKAIADEYKTEDGTRD